MSEQEKQESQKTVVAFIAGLLIGGLLVWVFGGSPETEPVANTVEEAETTEVETSANVAATTESETTAPSAVAELPTGNGAAEVADQMAGVSVSLNGATFPADEGWIGVRDFVDGQLSGLLGVVRYSKEQGLVPEAIALQRSTIAGNSYAIVFYSENGDRIFNLAEDVQEGGAVETFVAK